MIDLNKTRLYITLDDDTFYRVHPDFSQTIANKEEVLTEEHLLDRNNPTMVLHKLQFSYHKHELLNRQNPNSLTWEKALFYHKIGFISDEEWLVFKHLRR